MSIRPYRADDAPQLYAAARESIGDVFPWLAWCHPRYSLDEAADWARSREELARQGLEYHFVIESERSAFMGACGINHINRTAS